jgi:hypothetical protein
MPTPVPPMAETIPLDTNTMQGAMAEAGMAGGELAQTTIPTEALGGLPQPMTVASSPSNQIQVKELIDKSEQSIERWTEILARSVERVAERQQRVVLEKASGLKSKKALMHGTLDVDSVLSIETWNKQIEEDIRPVVSSIISDSFESRVNEASEKGVKVKALPVKDLRAMVDAHVSRIKRINEANFSEINSLMIKSFEYADEERRYSFFRDGLVEMYTDFFAYGQYQLAENEARSAWNFGQTV